ncbi:hypothetical protein STCU_00720 [Strigomonas culicis]|uniref:Uncharacterized protein n=1 Tax=Strigomonas culicis TaxID=28005 RepID=S9UFT4_9TRYP|nr:hypothetical protein STCU_06697 [Strigomonas culicis]EPY27783.1 hypothetical protein STCU_05555 [Strigomonas culicis]EPY36170.1 hypothetical protein STCU_00720 [Strigomonas culicis]|eukprot:EPY25546.1 hypothetical protein STCU_06697 [Strigomonas culicis]
MLFVAQEDKGILYSIESRNIVRNYTLQPVARHSCVYSPLHNCFVAHQKNGSAIFFSAFTQQPLLRCFVPEPLSSCAVSPCGLFMLGGTVSGHLIVWNVLTGCQVKMVSVHIRAVTSIAFSSDGALVATGSEDSLCKVWRMQALSCIKRKEVHPLNTFSGHTLPVTICRFFHHTSFIVTGALDKTCRVFDALSGEQLRMITVGDSVAALDISHDDACIAVGTVSGYLYFENLLSPFPSMSCIRQVVKSKPVLCECGESTNNSRAPIMFVTFMGSRHIVLVVSEGGAFLTYDMHGRVTADCAPNKKLKGNMESCVMVSSLTASKRTAAKLDKNPADPNTKKYVLRRVVAAKEKKHAHIKATPTPNSEHSSTLSETAHGALQEELDETIKQNRELEELKGNLLKKIKKLQ